MSLVFSGPRAITQRQFGVTEIASAIITGKLGDTILLSHPDVEILASLAVQYGVRFMHPPDWLRDVGG